MTRTPDHVHIRRRRWLISAFLLAASALLPAHAQRSMIDDLDVALEEGLVVITVRFGAPVRYLRHFPVEQGDLLEIQFQLLTNDPSATLAFDERRRVPSVQGLPTTTITYRHPVASDLLQNPPSLLVEFARPMSYRVRQGEDGRHLKIYVSVPPAGTTKAP